MVIVARKKVKYFFNFFVYMSVFGLFCNSLNVVNVHKMLGQVQMHTTIYCSWEGKLKTINSDSYQDRSWEGS